MHDVSSMRELGHTFADSGNGSSNSSVMMLSKVKEFEIEMERLASRIEHLKAQNEVLSLALGESKNQCENLTVLIGKGFKYL